MVEEDDPRPAVRPRKHVSVQFNTRLSLEHRQKLDFLLSKHPRSRATLRDVIEELIDHAFEDSQSDPS